MHEKEKKNNDYIYEIYCGVIMFNCINYVERLNDF